jgi:hypothetical protein
MTMTEAEKAAKLRRAEEGTLPQSEDEVTYSVVPRVIFLGSRGVATYRHRAGVLANFPKVVLGSL